MERPNGVQVLSEFRISVAYPDGTGGVIDLSADVGRGLFAHLADEASFQTVHIGRFGQIAWPEDIEICPDAADQESTSRTATGVTGLRCLRSIANGTETPPVGCYLPTGG